MHRTATQRAPSLALALVLATSAGPACSRAVSSRAAPAPQFDGVDYADRSHAAIYFGPVLVGARAERVVTIQPASATASAADAGVASVEKSPEFEKAFGFEVRPPGAEGPGGAATTKIAVAFAPTAPGDYSGQLQLDLGSASGGPVVIDVEGSAVGSCEPAAASAGLDFGVVQVGSISEKTARIRNPGGTPWRITLPPLEGGAFSFPAGASPAEHLIPAGPGELSFALQFKPARHGEQAAALALPVPVGCPARALALSGFGVATDLACEPVLQIAGRPQCQVDFGRVAPGGRGVAQLTLRNRSERRIVVSLGALTQPPRAPASTFGVENPGTPRDVTIAAGDAALVALAFSPAEPGQFRASLAFTSDAADYPAGSVALVGAGIGPKLVVSPPVVDLGVVPLGRGSGGEEASPPIETLIVLANEGAAGPAGDEGTLRFGERVPAGWLERAPELTGSDEFAFEWPAAGYSAEAGLPVDSVAELRILFTPHSYGRKSVRLTLRTNDDTARIVEVPIVATVAFDGSCDLELSPPTLNFGSVNQGTALVTRAIEVRNRAAAPEDACTLSGFGLAPEAGDADPNAFTLADVGQPSPVRIAGGEAVTLQVRFGSTVAGPHRATVRFATSRPGDPERLIALRGTAVAMPVVVSPPELDFGDVQIDCKRELHFYATNTGSAPVRIMSAELQVPGSSAPDTAFVLARRPALPTIPGLGVGKDLDFWVDYSDQDVRAHAAEVVIAVEGFPDPLRVPVRGRGVARRERTDVFHQRDRPKIDLLFVIDDSLSMADKQPALAQGLATIFDNIDSPCWDYHLGVTTTSVGGANDANGRLVPLSGPNPRVIGRTTPNKKQAFLQNASVGTSGNPIQKLFAPALLAVTPPLSTGDNADFYRPDADLGLFLISAAKDKDTTPVSDFVDAFKHLKGPGRRGLWGVVAFIPNASYPPAGCAYDSDDAGTSTRTQEFARWFGGIVEDVCEDPWHVWGFYFACTNGYGDPIQDYRFHLSAAPEMDPSRSIVVRIDGQTIPQRRTDGGWNWEIEEWSNNLVFDRDSLPDWGSTIEVTYRLPCP